MNDLALVPIADQLPGNLSIEEIDATRDFMDNATAECTRIAYDQDMHQFRQWCLARGACALPAAPSMVAAYLASLAASGRKAAGIGRAMAAIAWQHRQAGIDPSPTAHQGVKQTMRGIRRKIGSRKQGKQPATHDIIGAMMAGCPDTMIGLRDAALLGIGFAAALRRSELIAITVEDITFVDDGLRLLIPRSKTDQTGEGVEVAVIRGVRLRPVAALQAWLAASGITTGPVFRPVKLGGSLGGAMKRRRCSQGAEKALRPPGHRSDQLLGAQFACRVDHQQRGGECKYLPHPAGQSTSLVGEPARLCAIDRHFQRALHSEFHVMTTRKPTTQWDAPARRGEYDHLLAEIRNEVARQTPPPPPAPPSDPPRPPRVHVQVEVVQRKPPRPSRSGLWGAAIMVWLVVIAIVVMLLLSGCTAALMQRVPLRHWQSHQTARSETRHQGTRPTGPAMVRAVRRGSSYQHGL